MSDLPHAYRPPWAPHVEGRYTAREQVEGEPPEQRWSARCERCDAAWPPSLCTSGMVKRRISWFAQSHVDCEEKK